MNFLESILFRESLGFHQTPNFFFWIFHFDHYGEPRKWLFCLVVFGAVKRARKIYKNDGLGSEIRPSLQEVIQQNKEKHPQLFKSKKTEN